MTATPQARTSRLYDGRPACQNFGLCHKCPIGARYSPNHHLQLAISTGRCALAVDTSVRRIVPKRSGEGATLVYRPNGEKQDREHHARVVIVAAHTIETVRLLLLSRSSAHPEGLGNSGGALGRRFSCHHLWRAVIASKQRLFPERFGGWSAHVLQFCNPPSRGGHGGIKVELPDLAYDPWSLRLELERTKLRAANQLEAISPELKRLAATPAPRRGRDVVKLRDEFFNRWRLVMFHSEARALDRNIISLSQQRDRHGDPFAKVFYDGRCEFTEQTYAFARRIRDRLLKTLDVEEVFMVPASNYINGSHHLGGCEMGDDPDDSVVDQHGRIHGCPSCYVFGTAVFRGCSGAVNPTLTLIAMVLRNVALISERLGGVTTRSAGDPPRRPSPAGWRGRA
jgi:choline dehydrogenase-like flavoprotein